MSLGFMLVPKHLIVDVLAIVFSVTAALVLVPTQESFLLVDKGVESLQAVTGIVFELQIKELLLLGQHVLNCVNVHVLASECLSGENA